MKVRKLKLLKINQYRTKESSHLISQFFDYFYKRQSSNAGNKVLLCNKEIKRNARSVYVCTCARSCIPLQLRFWPLVSSCELRGEQPSRTMIPKCLRARSVKPVFKRQARRSNPVSLYRLFIVPTHLFSVRTNSMASDVGDSPAAPRRCFDGLFDFIMAYRYFRQIDVGHCSREYLSF